MEFDPKAVSLRADIFSDRKGIHIKLDKDTHSRLRSLCFHKGVSMQDIFEEFARSLCDGEKASITIIDKMIMRRLNLPKRIVRYRKKNATELEDKEKDALYAMINEENEKDQEET